MCPCWRVSSVIAPEGAREAASRSHRPEWRVRLWLRNGTTRLLPVKYGAVIKDLDSTTTINVEIPTGLEPGLLDQDYLPAGSSISAEYRIRNATPWLRIARCDIVSGAIARPESTWVLSCVDRGRRIAKDDLKRSRMILRKAPIAENIANIIRRTFPGINVEATGRATTMEFPTPDDLDITQGDPWALCKELAAAAGAIVYEDCARSVFVVENAPDLDDPVDSLVVGDGGSLTRYTIQHEMGPNMAIMEYVDADSNSVVRTGQAIDTSPTSPVAYQRVGTYIVTTEQARVKQAPGQADADLAALALLRRESSMMRRANLVHPQRPWLQPGETVSIAYLGGPVEDQVIERVEIPMVTGEEQVTVLRTDMYQMSSPLPYSNNAEQEG